MFRRGFAFLRTNCTQPALLWNADLDLKTCSDQLGLSMPFGRPFVKRFALCYRSVVLSVCPACPVCLSVCPVCDVGVRWHGGHIVLDGDPPPLPQGGTVPNFRPIFVAAKWLRGSTCHLVLMIFGRTLKIFLWGNGIVTKILSLCFLQVSV